MSPWKPDSSTVYRKECTECGSNNSDTIGRLVKCKDCGNYWEGVSAWSERMVYEQQQKT